MSPSGRARPLPCEVCSCSRPRPRRAVAAYRIGSRVPAGFTIIRTGDWLVAPGADRNLRAGRARASVSLPSRNHTDVRRPVRPPPDDRAAGARLGGARPQGARCPAAGAARGIRRRRPSATWPLPTPACPSATASHAARRRSKVASCRRSKSSRTSTRWRSARAPASSPPASAAWRAACARSTSSPTSSTGAVDTCAALGVHNVVAADGRRHAAGRADAYDVIAVTGSLPVYDARFEQALKVGGRLFVMRRHRAAARGTADDAHRRQRLGPGKPVRNRHGAPDPRAGAAEVRLLSQRPAGGLANRPTGDIV